MYSQELLDVKLKAIREAMNRPPAPAKKKLPKTAKVKPVRETKEKPDKAIKPNYFKNDGHAAYKNTKQKEKVFATIPLNLEEKIKIEIKKGLWIYVSPGADIEAIKAKYTKR